jgi:hypothetical protein
LNLEFQRRGRLADANSIEEFGRLINGRLQPERFIPQGVEPRHRQMQLPDGFLQLRGQDVLPLLVKRQLCPTGDAMERDPAHFSVCFAQSLPGIDRDGQHFAGLQAMIQRRIGHRCRIDQAAFALRRLLSNYYVVDPQRALFRCLSASSKCQQEMATVVCEEVPAFMQGEAEVFPLPVHEQRSETGRGSIDKRFYLAVGCPPEYSFTGAVAPGPERSRVGLAGLRTKGRLGS